MSGTDSEPIDPSVAQAYKKFKHPVIEKIPLRDFRQVDMEEELDSSRRGRTILKDERKLAQNQAQQRSTGTAVSAENNAGDLTVTNISDEYLKELAVDYKNHTKWGIIHGIISLPFVSTVLADGITFSSTGNLKTGVVGGLVIAGMGVFHGYRAMKHGEARTQIYQQQQEVQDKLQK